MLDYDDLLLYWHALMLDDEAGAQSVRERFDCVLVDEYQDTNPLQAEILYGLCPRRQGPDRRGRRRPVDLLLPRGHRAQHPRLPQAVPRHDGRHARAELPQHAARSSTATNDVIWLWPRERFTKNLWSDRDRGRAARVGHLRGRSTTRPSSSSARSSSIARRASTCAGRPCCSGRRTTAWLLEAELARRNIPFHKYGGLKFVETAHVKDLMAFLRLAENPRDVVRRHCGILCLLPGIGPRKAATA